MSDLFCWIWVRPAYVGRKESVDELNVLDGCLVGRSHRVERAQLEPIVQVDLDHVEETENQQVEDVLNDLDRAHVYGLVDRY
jgi:hypothetical protein